MKPKNMIPLSIVLALISFGLFCYGMSESKSPSPVRVGEIFKDDDPYRQHVEITVMEINGDWIKYTMTGDSVGSYRSTRLGTFRVWYPNKVSK